MKCTVINQSPSAHSKRGKRHDPLRDRGVWGGRKFGCRDDPEARSGFGDPDVHEGGGLLLLPAGPDGLSCRGKNPQGVHPARRGVVREEPDRRPPLDGDRSYRSRRPDRDDEGRPDLCLRPASSGDGRQVLASGHQGRRCTGSLHAEDPGRRRCHPEARRVGKIRCPHRRRPSGPRGGKRAA